MRGYKREPYADQTFELYMNVINLAALKASDELMAKISAAVSSQNYSEAKQLFYQLRYIYDRLPPEPSRVVYLNWEETVQQFQ